MNNKNNNTWVIVLIVVLLAVFLFGGFGFGMMGSYGGMTNMMNWMFGSNTGTFGGFWWPFMWLFMAAFWVLVVLGIIWLVKQLQNPQPQRVQNSRRRR